MKNGFASLPARLAHAPGSPISGVIALAHRIGASGSSAVVHGESGTGKETVARLVHAAGLAPDATFVPVACAGRSEGELADELFGAGGSLEAAAGGTLFLEDISELPLALEGRLVRVAIDAPAAGGASGVRIVGASTIDLRPHVSAGRFRRDLFDALACPIHVPPLRDRRDDIAVLVERLWAELAPDRELTASARELLRQYAWPGNAREVEAIVRRLAAHPGQQVIGRSDVQQHLFSAATGMPFWVIERDAALAGGPAVAAAPNELRLSGVDVHLPAQGIARVDLQDVLRQVESTLIGWALDRTKGNKAAAAEMLGLRRTTLVEKIRRLREVTAVAVGAAASTQLSGH